MVSYSGTAKILDFGVAKATAIASGTRAGIIKGKYAYLSPEQARGVPADQLIDGVRVVDYGGFVDLVAENGPVQAWL